MTHLSHGQRWQAEAVLGGPVESCEGAKFHTDKDQGVHTGTQASVHLSTTHKFQILCTRVCWLYTRCMDDVHLSEVLVHFRNASLLYTQHSAAHLTTRGTANTNIDCSYSFRLQGTCAVLRQATDWLTTFPCWAHRTLGSLSVVPVTTEEHFSLAALVWLPFSTSRHR